MKRSLTVEAFAFAILALAPSVAHAQSASANPAQSIQDVLSFLVINRSVETSDFDKDRDAAEATRQTITRALLSSVSTLPVTSSSSGFTYKLNSSLGTFERASALFGPFFVERARTTGAGRASLGVTFQYASFDSLDGNDLDDGNFTAIANQFIDEPQPFDVETLTLGIKTRTTTVFGNIGVTDRIEIGAAVPFVRLDVTGTRINTYRGQSVIQARATSQATGIADIALRSKIRLTGESMSGVAAGVEVRLPTGRENDLLGTGRAALRLLGLASLEHGLMSVDGNIAVGVGGLGQEVAFGAALGVAASPRLTLVGETMVRRIDGTQRISEVVAPHPRIFGVTTMRLMPTGSPQTSAYAVGGAKWNVGGDWLLQMHVLMPLTDAGLTARFTPAVALDYSFRN